MIYQRNLTLSKIKLFGDLQSDLSNKQPEYSSISFLMTMVCIQPTGQTSNVYLIRYHVQLVAPSSISFFIILNSTQTVVSIIETKMEVKPVLEGSRFFLLKSLL